MSKKREIDLLVIILGQCGCFRAADLEILLVDRDMSSGFNIPSKAPYIFKIMEEASGASHLALPTQSHK